MRLRQKAKKYKAEAERLRKMVAPGTPEGGWKKTEPCKIVTLKENCAITTESYTEIKESNRWWVIEAQMMERFAKAAKDFIQWETQTDNGITVITGTLKVVKGL